jgi:outer membrane protein TolC
MPGNKRLIRTLCFIALSGGLPVAPVLAQAASPQIRFITLDEAQSQAAAATQKNLGRFGIDAAKYHRQAAQADYFPKIDATFLNMHFNKLLGQQFELFNRQRALPLFGKNMTAFAFTVTQPVTPLLQVHQAVNIARADEEIAKAKADALAAQIAANVQQAYFGLLIAQRQQTVAATKVRMLESRSQIASTVAVMVGNTTGRQTVLLEANKELVAATDEVTELTRSLNALIGLPADTKLGLAVPEPAAETISLPQVTQQAVANSPEVIEAEQTVVKAKAASKLSKLEYIPSVAVVGGYFNQPQAVIPALPQDFSFLGFMATYTLFDFGKREKTVSERSAQVSMAEANLTLVQAKVAAGAQKAYLELERSRKIRDLTRRLAVSDPEMATDDPIARAKAEVEMFQAEMEYRTTFAQLKRIMDGR